MSYWINDVAIKNKNIIISLVVGSKNTNVVEYDDNGNEQELYTKKTNYSYGT